MKNPKKRIKVAPIETSLLYLVMVLLPLILLVIAMLSSSLRAEWNLRENFNRHQIPSHQGWKELTSDKQ
ncbi:hypothetical protein Bealeia1_01590 [Candidatus Bealeia paramacronuclearis]|uniref:Uncharacterized protein n=1 Tax=Candidatus Bealeia paramacronuclearis TaxID=1921001 RepID=A0ABZ2C4S9_9PROT|nr:hypothetical protein [Candidatus Bealeia paramacronuclearis]